nr:DUF3106 domain-containing protein [uncultured Aquabacterium sp.]
MTLPRFAPMRRIVATALVASLACCAWAAPAAPVQGSAQAQAHAPTQKAFGAGHEWSTLTAAQRQALAPLAAQWPQMPASSREKWVVVARRFDQLSPQEKARIQERMTQWAALPSHQRGEARLRFQQSRQLPADQRQQKWEQYQALSDEDKRDLGRQAKRRSQPVALSDSVAGPREAGQAYHAKRSTQASDAPRKSNVVPNTVTATATRPTVVAPALVKPGAGATTNLVTRAPSPPLHQQAGLPKISASGDFVDPVTLLPRTGAQGAAMSPPPASRP